MEKKRKPWIARNENLVNPQSHEENPIDINVTCLREEKNSNSNLVSCHLEGCMSENFQQPKYTQSNRRVSLIAFLPLFSFFLFKSYTISAKVKFPRGKLHVQSLAQPLLTNETRCHQSTTHNSNGYPKRTVNGSLITPPHQNSHIRI